MSLVLFGYILRDSRIFQNLECFRIDFQIRLCIGTIEELHGPTVSALRRVIAEVKQRWSIIGWVTKNLLSLLIY
jgi:hypothetical protein